ncbi:hypothetical protein TvY486_0045800 [Trypanosoma vivax Y486]|uniref:Uncharacterized protein n=1 Tax=Trypanosoma vivax (strain Y486) TaxID=1055687 RepID=F9WVQ1_TRYVY|nr:hypothetical protein TvY486_0045800 [Trypanosoma vivax Y486]|eukprot:CCD21659.1 hypothetical protein TvY486_0045800 [Trypanosoma vivax Y486]
MYFWQHSVQGVGAALRIKPILIGDAPPFSAAHNLRHYLPTSTLHKRSYLYWLSFFTILSAFALDSKCGLCLEEKTLISPSLVFTIDTHVNSLSAICSPGAHSAWTRCLIMEFPLRWSAAAPSGVMKRRSVGGDSLHQ